MDEKKEGAEGGEGSCCRTGKGCCCKAVAALVLLLIGGIAGYLAGHRCGWHHGMAYCPMTQSAPAQPSK